MRHPPSTCLPTPGVENGSCMSNRAHLPGDTASDDPRVGRIQLAALIGSIVIAAVVGTWAYFFPAQFYDRFPAVLGEWISQDGPYNEHLIRDHGAQYLALGLASVFGLFWHSQIGYRLLGIAWTTSGCSTSSITSRISATCPYRTGSARSSFSASLSYSVSASSSRRGAVLALRDGYIGASGGARHPWRQLT